MSSEPLPGDDEQSLEQLVRRLHNRVTELEAENEQLRQRIDTLEHQQQEQPTLV